MKNTKKLLSIVLAICMVAMLGVTAYATMTDVETGNNPGIIDLTHLDVKGIANYNAKLDGQDVHLQANLDPNSIVVTVKGATTNINYTFANYAYLTLTEKGMTEYRIILDGTDGALLSLIHWDGISFRMDNVYVSAKLIFEAEDVPEAIAEAADMTDNGDGTYSLLWSGKYTGIQECTGHNGLRSEGNHGLILGLDLYLDVPGVSVTIPEETDPTEPEETTVPEETTEPEETTVPEETTKPEEGTKPTEGTTDDEPDTGDNSVAVLLTLMTISGIGMVVTAMTGSKKLFGR